MPVKTDILHVRIAPELKAEAQKRADEEGRTLSNYIGRLLEKELAPFQGQKTPKTAKKGP